VSRRRLAAGQRSPRAAGWCATSSRRRGGRWPTRRATRPTLPRRGAATERVQCCGHATPRYLVVTRFVLPCIAHVMSSFRTDQVSSSTSTSRALLWRAGPEREVGRRSVASWAWGMKTKPIVLVPGFWLGAWAWDEVAAALRTDGHDVRALTLPGLESADADRSRVALADHVDAICEAVMAAGAPVVLAVHNGAGLPG